MLGINVQYAYSDRFGYVNTTTLVGNIVTNNPFHNSTNPDISRDLIFGTTSTPSANFPLIESSGVNGVPWRSFFGNHAFATLNGNVYDACGGPILGISVQNYFDTVIDYAANMQLNLKIGRKYFGESAAEITFGTFGIVTLR